MSDKTVVISATLDSMIVLATRLAYLSCFSCSTGSPGLIVEPGMRMGPDGGKPIPVGVPFGSRARLILLYLQSEALRTGSREVRLGRSLRDWFGRMGIVPAGKNITAVREQAERISLCRLPFHVRWGKKGGLLNQNIVKTGCLLVRTMGLRAICSAKQLVCPMD